MSSNGEKDGIGSRAVNLFHGVPLQSVPQRYEITDKIFQDNGPGILPAVAKYLTCVAKARANSKQPREEAQKTSGTGLVSVSEDEQVGASLPSPGCSCVGWHPLVWSCPEDVKSPKKLAIESLKEVFRQVNLFPDEEIKASDMTKMQQ